MHGNVMEWTADQYLADAYSKTNKTLENPLVVPVELYPRAVRGGSFIDDAAALRSANRIPSDPVWKQIDTQILKSDWWFTSAILLGMRVVREADRKSTRLNSSHYCAPRMTSHAC